MLRFGLATPINDRFNTAWKSTARLSYNRGLIFENACRNKYNISNNYSCGIDLKGFWERRGEKRFKLLHRKNSTSAISWINFTRSTKFCSSRAWSYKCFFKWSANEIRVRFYEILCLDLLMKQSNSLFAFSILCCTSLFSLYTTKNGGLLAGRRLLIRWNSKYCTVENIGNSSLARVGVL